MDLSAEEVQKWDISNRSSDKISAEEIVIISKKNTITIASVLVLSALVLFFVLFEIAESRKDLLKTVEDESRTLIAALSNSIEINARTNYEIENLLIDKLNAGAEIAALAEGKPYTNKILNDIAEEFDLSHISVISPEGRILHSSFFETLQTFTLPADFLEALQPVLSGEYIWIDLDLVNNPLTGDDMYLLARSRKSAGGCVLSGIDAARLLEFRRKIGIGRKIQEIGSNPSIIYALLQDTLGILTASKEVEEMSPIIADSFLKSAWNTNRIMTRIRSYGERNVLETVKTITLDDGTKILNRIGLSLERVEQIQQKAVRRAVFLGAGIFLLGAFLIGFIMNREKLLRLESEHKMAQSYIDIILNGINDAVVAVDAEMNIVAFNNAAEEIFGIGSENVLGREYSEIFKNDELQILKANSGDGSLDYSEVQCSNFRNINRVIGLSVSSIQSYANSSTGIDMILAIARDLTERRRLTERLSRKEKLSAMGELAGAVAHEIRNPLNAINVIVQRFQYEFEPKNDAEEYLGLAKTVRSEVERVNKIINQFLEFARPKKIHRESIMLSKLFGDTANIVKSQAVANNIVLVNQLESDFEICVDVEKMKQVLLNLMQNSIEAMPRGGELSYWASKVEDNIIIEIKDTGEGIPTEKLPKIFDLYFTTKSQGTGLGLSIVHQIISEHGGEISIDSADGLGANVKITLPDSQAFDEC